MDTGIKGRKNRAEVKILITLDIKLAIFNSDFSHNL